MNCMKRPPRERSEKLKQAIGIVWLTVKVIKRRKKGENASYSITFLRLNYGS